MALLVGGIVYGLTWSVSGFDWLMFDDDINVLVNPHLGLGPATVHWAFTDFDYIRRYIPLGWLTFDALLRVDGYNPVVFHLASVVLHTLNAVLAFFAFRALLRWPMGRGNSATPPSNRIMGWAAIAALVWSVHPLRAENTGWISGLLYLASTTLALAAGLILFSAPRRTGKSPGQGAAMLSAVLFTGSLLVYPVYLGLPAVLTLWFARSTPSWADGVRRIGRLLGPWWLAAIAIGLLDGYAALTAKGAFARVSPALSPGAALLGCGKAMAVYAVHTLWPQNLGVYYGPIQVWLRAPAEKIAAAVAITVVAGLLARKATRPATLWFIAMLIASLAPFLLQFDATFTPSDRYSVLWLAILCVSGASWCSRLSTSIARNTAVVAVLAITLALSVTYRDALQPWRDTIRLQQAIDLRNASRPNAKLDFGRPALEFWWLGHRAEAFERLNAGMRRFPADPGLQEDSQTLQELDQRWHARVSPRTDIPPLAVLHVDLGHQCLGQHAPASAISHFKAALVLAPTYPEAARALAAATASRAAER